MDNIQLIDKLNNDKTLEKDEFVQLISTYNKQDMEYASGLARSISVQNYGKKIYFRGIVEFTNICKNNCYYCGIRKDNADVTRYRLDKSEILQCCDEGYSLGYRTFVLQGGEDGYFTDERLCEIVSDIHEKYPDCAITLSVGERSYNSYKSLYDAGATRYLLRHETINKTHYSKLHPSEMSLDNRIECLYNLKAIGYQTGCGMMIGAPFQTAENIAEDMLFMKKFQPHMIGMGPFIAHHSTPFCNFENGSAERTIFMLSLCRIMLPYVLLPATTALGTLGSDGRQRGVLAGANVIMPNLSPLAVRKKYMLYDNKAGMSDDAKSGLDKLRKQMNDIGYEMCVDIGNCLKGN